MRWGKPKEDTGRGADGAWYVIGAPLAGTDGAVDAIEKGDGGDAAALVAIDTAFNVTAFVEWSETVYDRAVTAWHSRSPEPLRPVMDAAVWNSYAEHLLTVSTLPLAQSLMAAARGTPRLVGAAADAGYQSAIVGFAVQCDPAVFAHWDLGGDNHGWSERWLFQRPASARTHPSGAVAVCPVCGAPVEPEESGKCRYCHSDITTRTAGWLVTRTATTMTRMAKMDDRLAELRAKQAARFPMPAPAAGAPPQPPRAGPPLQPPRAGA